MLLRTDIAKTFTKLGNILDECVEHNEKCILHYVHFKIQ